MGNGLILKDSITLGFVASLTKLILDSRYSYALWAAFVLAFYASLDSWLPHGIHFWAQSDRLALAYGFFDNGLNFFDPRTLSMDTTNGSVGVEFPLVPYLTAVVATLSGKSYIPFIFRGLNLLVLCGGMLTFIRSIDQSKLRVMVLWALTLSPMLLFYSSNLIPDTASLGFALAGIGFAFSYFSKGNLKLLGLSLLFFCLAALLKASAGIYLLAFGGTYVYDAIIRKNTKRAFTIITWCVLFIGIVVGYDYFFVVLRNKTLWSVIFMSEAKAVGSVEQFGIVMNSIRDWGPEYGNIILRLILLFGAFWWIKDAVNGDLPNWQRVFMVFSLIGVLSILILFGKQFINHDYYFISAFYPLVAIMVRHFFVRGSRRYQGIISPNFIWVLLLAMGADQTFAQAQRREGSFYAADHRDYKQDLTWMKGGREQIERIATSEDLIFVFYDDPPNTSLIYLGRRGLTFNHEEMSRPDEPGKNIRYWIDRLEPAYFVCPNIWLDQFKIDQPQLYSELRLVEQNKQFSIFELSDEIAPDNGY